MRRPTPKQRLLALECHRVIRARIDSWAFCRLVKFGWAARSNIQAGAKCDYRPTPEGRRIARDIRNEKGFFK